MKQLILVLVAITTLASSGTCSTDEGTTYAEIDRDLKSIEHLIGERWQVSLDVFANSKRNREFFAEPANARKLNALVGALADVGREDTLSVERFAENTVIICITRDKGKYRVILKLFVELAHDGRALGVGMVKSVAFP
jgi:hypothetical protein